LLELIDSVEAMINLAVVKVVGLRICCRQHLI